LEVNKEEEEACHTPGDHAIFGPVLTDFDSVLRPGSDRHQEIFGPVLTDVPPPYP